MNLGAGLHAVACHGMRAYYLPAIAGLLLIVSAFLPWVVIGGVSLGGVPDLAGLWVLGLGILAVVFASLSIVTRKNSRHPLLVVGLAALGIVFLGERLMERAAAEQAWAVAQAVAIVDGVRASDPPPPVIAFGAYLGLAGAVLLVLFGLTIVVRRARMVSARPEDDDA